MGVSQDAIELARRAEAIAWPPGLTKVLSSALNTEAYAVQMIGGEWADTLRQSLDIALTGRHEAEVARAYVNLHACHVAERDWATAERYFTPGIAHCDDRDIITYSIYLRSERTSVLERTGRGMRPRQAHQCGDRPEAVHLGQDRRPPRVSGAGQAGRADPPPGPPSLG